MFVIRIADLIVEIDNRYGYVEQLCRKYCISNTSQAPAFRVRVGDSDVSQYVRHCGRPITAAEAESYLLYRRICEQMPYYDGILLHAAAVEMDGKGYLFSAPRGTGKTTHTNLWLAHFLGRATVINGDKPILRRAADGRFWFYGTPWCGKEGREENRRAPLTAICFLKQGSTNRMALSSTTDTTVGLLQGTLLPPDTESQDRMAALIGEIVRTIPAYTLVCRPEPQAAEVAYECLAPL